MSGNPRKRGADHNNREKARKRTFVDSLNELGDLLNAKKQQDIVDSALIRIKEDQCMIRNLRKTFSDVMEENKMLKEHIQRLTGNGGNPSVDGIENAAQGSGVSAAPPVTPSTQHGNTNFPTIVPTGFERASPLPATSMNLHSALPMTPTFTPTQSAQFAQYPFPTFNTQCFPFPGFNGSFMTPPQSRVGSPFVMNTSSPGSSHGAPQGNYFCSPADSGYGSPLTPFTPMFPGKVNQAYPPTSSLRSHVSQMQPMQQQSDVHPQTPLRSQQFASLSVPVINAYFEISGSNNGQLPVSEELVSTSGDLQNEENLKTGNGENRPSTDTPVQESTEADSQSDEFFRNFAEGLKRSSSEDQNAKEQVNIDDLPLNLTQPCEPLFAYLEDEDFHLNN